MRPERGNVSEPVDDKRTATQKKRRSLISRSPTPEPAEPRDPSASADPAAPPRAEERVHDAFVGVFGPIADATDAPMPAGMVRREPDPGRPRPPDPRGEPVATATPEVAAAGEHAAASLAAPYAKPPIADLETPLYAPRHPARDTAPPEPEGDKTIPPEPNPLGSAFEPLHGAAPAIPGGWTAPPPPSRPREPRPGPSATVVVASILTGVIVLAVVVLVTVFGGGSSDAEPRLAPGTPAPAVPVEKR
jgi:hypothetical protein